MMPFPLLHRRRPPSRHPLLAPLALLVLLQGSACTDNRAPGPTPGGGDAKVLVIGIDGLRGDGIPGAETPHLDALIDGGAWTLFASTQLGAPTVSGPGWSSILCGVDADKHNIYGNGGWDDIDRAYPTMIGRAHELGLPTATAINWTPIQENIIEPAATNEFILGTDEEVADGMAALLETGDYDLYFVALDDIDGAGHGYGFDPEVPEYQAAVEQADDQVGRMIDAVAARASRSDESWLIAVTTDHGGQGTGHGGVTAPHRTIPVIFAGDTVVPGEFEGADGVPGELDVGFVSHMDIHPTVFQHLGFPPETSWALDGFVRGIE